MGLQGLLVLGSSLGMPGSSSDALLCFLRPEMCPASLDKLFMFSVQTEYSFISLGEGLQRGGRKEVGEESQELPLVTFPELLLAEKKTAASCQLKSLWLALAFGPLLLSHSLPLSSQLLVPLLCLLPEQGRSCFRNEDGLLWSRSRLICF